MKTMEKLARHNAKTSPPCDKMVHHRQLLQDSNNSTLQQIQCTMQAK
jgi:hypothetical protein